MIMILLMTVNCKWVFDFDDCLFVCGCECLCAVF
uniref:Uncharacterized protein n=1 Tax=Rhizophora mucronata TaxID=61149 RepID=A0A2P2PVH2_RHIMU